MKKSQVIWKLWRAADVGVDADAYVEAMERFSVPSLVLNGVHDCENVRLMKCASSENEPDSASLASSRFRFFFLSFSFFSKLHRC